MNRALTRPLNPAAWNRYASPNDDRGSASRPASFRLDTDPNRIVPKLGNQRLTHDELSRHYQQQARLMVDWMKLVLLAFVILAVWTLVLSRVHAVREGDGHETRPASTPPKSDPAASAPRGFVRSSEPRRPLSATAAVLKRRRPRAVLRP